MAIQLEQLQHLARQAEEQFNSSSYGQSVCHLHKQGQVSNRLKFCEGRDFVARKILKIAQKHNDIESIEKALADLERKNTAIKESLVLTSPDWQSYAEGALSMIKEITSLVNRS
ncbi:MAG: hypothetical protein JXQ81_09005 [Desulfuromonadales bacterium]|nr:hypothetical protein [Desulfuromonadales bacterium]MBN2792629.1 hypothetical protein [Desulfuromonadales bacterium]